MSIGVFGPLIYASLKPLTTEQPEGATHEPIAGFQREKDFHPLDLKLNCL